MEHQSNKYYSIYFFPILLIFQLFYGYDSIIISSLTPFCIIFILPILEFIFKDFKAIYEEKEFSYLYQIPILLWTPVQVLLLLLCCNYIHNFNYYCLILFSISVGMITGSIGINVAHELLHKNNFIESSLSKILLCSVCYGHFYIEHIWGHHKKVATLEDPATSRLNETIYSFLPRSIIGGYKDAYEICENNKFPANLNFFGFKLNGVLIFNISTIVYLVFMACYFGIYALLFLLLQSVIAIIMLESANYIEHYGLLRDSMTKVNIMNSWNCDNYITKILTFGLPYHSDHHFNSKKEYYKLCDYDYTPKLPFGYMTCIILSYIPPLWFNIMNQRICKFNKRDQ